MAPADGMWDDISHERHSRRAPREQLVPRPAVPAMKTLLVLPLLAVHAPRVAPSAGPLTASSLAPAAALAPALAPALAAAGAAPRPRPRPPLIFRTEEREHAAQPAAGDRTAVWTLEAQRMLYGGHKDPFLRRT